MGKSKVQEVSGLLSVRYTRPVVSLLDETRYTLSHRFLLGSKDNQSSRSAA